MSHTQNHQLGHRPGACRWFGRGDSAEDSPDGLPLMPEPRQYRDDAVIEAWACEQLLGVELADIHDTVSEAEVLSAKFTRHFGPRLSHVQDDLFGKSTKLPVNGDRIVDHPKLYVGVIPALELDVHEPAIRRISEHVGPAGANLRQLRVAPALDAQAGEIGENAASQQAAQDTLQGDVVFVHSGEKWPTPE